MKISIIIPFNKPKRYLQDCLNSLADENLNDVEVILILNGVCDDLNDLLEEFSLKLNLIIKEFSKELEIGKARNIGLDLASGDYVYFMDSDDYIYDNGLNKLLNAANEYHADFINGEKIKTPYIRQRFEETLEKPKNAYLQGNPNDLSFSIKLLVGQKNESHEFLSVLHALIKRDKIGNIRFNENERYFTDCEFMINVLDNIDSFCGVENAIYAKRMRDDPVNLTSLNQEVKHNDYSLFLKEYFKIKESISNKSKIQFEILNEEILKKMYKYYYHTFSANYVNNDDDIWRTEYLEYISEISKDFKPEIVSWKGKWEVKSLQKKDFDRFSKLVNLRFFYVKFKQMLKKRWRLKRFIYNVYYNKKTVKKNKLLFESFYGRYYSDSPKYIYEYLYENHNDDFEFVWVINDRNVDIPGNPKTVKRFSLGYYKHLGLSEYYIFNTRHPARISKNDNQKFICTWHGTPLKRLGFDIGNLYVNNPNVKHAYRRDALMWDYMVSPNKYTTDILRKAFTFEGEIIESGYPRNDILYNANESKVNQIKSDLNLPDDKKIILYAPTWRDDEQFDVASVKFSLKLDLDRLKKEFSDEYIILLRMHYFIANNLSLDGLEGFAFDVSKYEDIGELYLISDLLITDYSSVFFDYANLKRPILFYTYDLEKYETTLRGFYIDIHKDIPGPLLVTNDEVVEAVRNINQINEQYAQRYDEFYDRFCSIDDGNASKRIYERILK